MPLIISEVDHEKDFDKICFMDHDAWKVPYNPQLKHFRVDIADRDAAIATSIAKKTKSFREHNPKRFMLKVVDTDTDDIIGYAEWELNDKPDPSAQKTIVTWYPEGSDEKEFAERFINGLWGFLGKRVTRPHMDLHSLVVHTEHRYRGAGKMLIRWGIAKADELGVETVVSSLPSARGAYEKSGLGYIEVIPPDESLNVENPSEKWKQLQADDLSGFLMWRPIGHDYVEGVDKAPWL